MDISERVDFLQKSLSDNTDFYSRSTLIVFKVKTDCIQGQNMSLGFSATVAGTRFKKKNYVIRTTSLDFRPQIVEYFLKLWSDFKTIFS